MMGTRSGSVDPGILTYLVRQRHLSGQQLDEILNQKAISYSLQESAKTHPKFALRCVKILRSLT
jgi:acetate kinase